MNIGAIIPIRLKSERLPNKALLEIAGRPVCYHLLDQVCDSKYIRHKRNVVVCTTTHQSDDPLVDVIHDYGCSVFRGDSDDIIARFYEAMIEFKFDSVIQADGDDPLSAREYMDLTMKALLENPEVDVVTVKGLPLGCATKSFRRRALEKVRASYLTKKNDTGFIYFLTKTGLCDHLELECSELAHQHETARLTLDYYEDFELFVKIIESIKNGDKALNLSDVVSFLRRHPDVAASNAHVEKEYWRRTREKLDLQYRSVDNQILSITI